MISFILHNEKYAHYCYYYYMFCIVFIAYLYNSVFSAVKTQCLVSIILSVLYI